MTRKLLVLFVAILLTVAVAAVYVVIYRPRQDLNRFLTEIEATQVGETTLSEWRNHLMHNRSSHITLQGDGTTSAVSWHGDNNLLKNLGLAPRTVVRATVGFRNGVASSVYVVLDVLQHGEQDWHHDRGVVIRLSDDNPLACHEDYSVEVKELTGGGGRNWATVAMDRCVSRENFKKAVIINADCLTRIGGCKTLEAMLPLVFGHP